MKPLIKFILCLSLTNLIVLPEAFAKGGSCTAKIVGKCKTAGRAAGETDAVTGGASNPGILGVGAAATGTGRRMAAAGEECKASAADCEKCPPAEREQCKKEVEGAAGDMKAQSAGMGDAGAALGAIAGLAGALIPLLMKKEEEEKPPAQDPNAAMQCNNGVCTVDCSKNDAFNYQGCNDKLAASCKNAMSDWRCVSFANRYCNAEGVGSQFCNSAVAYAFCAPGGHDMCPSCLQLQKENSPACIQNPALCIGQNSPDETEKLRGACPNDPVFVGGGTPGFQTGPLAGGGVNPVPPTAGGTNPNLPPPVLPAGGVNGGNPPAGGGGGTVAVQSVGGSQPGRDAHNNNPTGGAGGIAAQSAAGAVGGTPTRDMAGGGMRTASVGPAPDVNGQFGPSLFATSSQVIRSRCAAGRFMNCP